MSAAVLLCSECGSGEDRTCRRCEGRALARTCTCVWPTSCPDCERLVFFPGRRVRTPDGREGVVGCIDASASAERIGVKAAGVVHWYPAQLLEVMEVDSTASSVAEALEDALEREPKKPTRFKCPHCEREHTEQQWQCLDWLQFAGAIRSGRLLVSAEVRRCVCSLPIARECVLPLVEVLP